MDLDSTSGAEDDDGVQKAAEDVDTATSMPLRLRSRLGRKEGRKAGGEVRHKEGKSVSSTVEDTWLEWGVYAWTN